MSILDKLWYGNINPQEQSKANIDIRFCLMIELY